MKKLLSFLLVFSIILFPLLDTLAEEMEIDSEPAEETIYEEEESLLETIDDTVSEYSNTLDDGLEENAVEEVEYAYSVPTMANTYTINGVTVYATMVADPGNGQCWEYANRIYNIIWGRRFTSTFVGDAGSGHNLLRNLNDSDRTLTPEHLKNFIGQAALGASIRIGGCTSSCAHFNDDGLACGHSGHSLILVAKSDSGFTTFERATGYARREYTWTWDSFCNWFSSYPYIKYIKWPGASEYSGQSTPAADQFKYDINSCGGDGSVIYLRGWVFNYANIEKSIQLHVYLDGGVGSSTQCWSIPANVSRKDVDSAYHVGEFHGFEYTIIGVPQGNHVLFLYANDQYRNTNTFIGQYSVTVSQDQFVFDVNSCSGGEESAYIRGWLFNQNNIAKSIQIHVYLDGAIGKHTACWSFDANTSRKDVDDYYHVGEFHGFNISINDLSPGSHTLYLYANDQFRNSNTFIGPYSISVSEKAATPTPRPTATPTPKPTATPTSKPTITPSIRPTATPTPRPTATPEPKNYFHLKKNTSKQVNVRDTIQIIIDGQMVKNYKTSDKKIATVSGKGLVTAKKSGTAKITVTLANKKKLVLTLKVVDPKAPTKVALNLSGTVKLKKGNTLQLSAILSPATAESALTWKSSDKKIATVSASGLVKAKKKGTATITVKTKNGKTAKVKIKVVN